jgi:hypothetical protein
MGIEVLEVIGDLDLVVMQVKDNFLVKNDRLKWDKDVVWDNIELFDAFSIKSLGNKMLKLMILFSYVKASF